jgi:peptide-methionine (S)-S-oxide reductase
LTNPSLELYDAMGRLVSSSFKLAEDYHHNYFNNNKSQGYCQFVIQPKIEKYKKIFEK